MLSCVNMNKDWPFGRAIFHNEAKTLLIWVNEEDHIRIISMQRGHDINEVFERLCEATKQIEEKSKLKYMHDRHLGYVTCCPTNIGTTLRASVHVNLPKLMHNKEKLQDHLDEYIMQARPIYTDQLSFKDGLHDISNRVRVGKSECEIMQEMIDCVRDLVQAEAAEPAR